MMAARQDGASAGPDWGQAPEEAEVAPREADAPTLQQQAQAAPQDSAIAATSASGNTTLQGALGHPPLQAPGQALTTAAFGRPNPGRFGANAGNPDAFGGGGGGGLRIGFGATTSVFPGQASSSAAPTPERDVLCEALLTAEPGTRQSAAEKLRTLILTDPGKLQLQAGSDGVQEIWAALMTALESCSAREPHVAKELLGALVAIEPAALKLDQRPARRGFGDGFGAAAPAAGAAHNYYDFWKQKMVYGPSVLKLLQRMLQPAVWKALIRLLQHARDTPCEAAVCAADRAAHLLAVLASSVHQLCTEEEAEQQQGGNTAGEEGSDDTTHTGFPASEAVTACAEFSTAMAGEHLPLLLDLFKRGCRRPSSGRASDQARQQHSVVFEELSRAVRSSPGAWDGMAFPWYGFGSPLQGGGGGGFGANQLSPAAKSGEMRVEMPTAPCHLARNIATILDFALASSTAASSSTTVLAAGVDAVSCRAEVRGVAMAVLGQALVEVEECTASRRREQIARRPVHLVGGPYMYQSEALTQQMERLSQSVGPLLAVQLIEKDLLAEPTATTATAARTQREVAGTLLHLVAAPGTLEPSARTSNSFAGIAAGGGFGAAGGFGAGGGKWGNNRNPSRPAACGLAAAAVHAARLLHDRFGVDIDAEVAHIREKQRVRAQQFLSFALGTLEHHAHDDDDEDEDGDDGDCARWPENYSLGYDVVRQIAAYRQLPALDTVVRAANDPLAQTTTSTKTDHHATSTEAAATAAAAAVSRRGVDATVEQVAAWVGTLGFCEEAAAFRAHEIDGAALSELTDADLSELGVGIIGRRKRILRGAREMVKV